MTLLPRPCWLLALLGLVWLAGAKPCHGRDVRVALLVGNQRGWSKEPRLRYVVQGDLRPLARLLRRNSFQVHTLINQDAKALRKAFARITQGSQKRPITTFLFYYSGHSDTRHLHMGAKGPKPYSYAEFAKAFTRLPVQRRIAIFDSCYSGQVIRQFGSLTRFKKLLRSGRGKGLRKRAKRIDLRKLIRNDKGYEQGVRIISSSLDVSWELDKLKASVFTHFLLKGLQGKADANTDGKISVDELFNYASLQVLRMTGQRPQQLLLLRREQPYALVPSYDSKLLIRAKVRGKLRVSVANFYWVHHKTQAQPVQLDVVHGKARVDLEHKGRCYRQQLRLPKGRSTTLPEKWRSIPCQKLRQARKGSVYLPALSQALPRPRQWSLDLQGGAVVSPLVPSLWLGGGALALRHRFGGIALAAAGASARFGDAYEAQLLFALQLEAGYRFDLGAWELFAGGFAGLQIMLQQDPEKPRQGSLFHYGLTILASLRLAPRWGLFVQLKGGFSLGQIARSLQHLPTCAGSLGLRFFL